MGKILFLLKLNVQLQITEEKKIQTNKRIIFELVEARKKEMQEINFLHPKF
jgi:hypothetical protein